MASMAVQLLGFFLGLLGFTGTVVATVLPHWRSTAYVGSNIITATTQMKGLWMECVWHSTGIYQCELYRSLLALPRDLQAARALMVLSCVTSVLASVVSVMGMKCTRFARDSLIKSPLVLSGGICFLCAGLLCLITVSWTTNDVIVEFYDPFLPSGLKYEIGLAVYLGYASACLSLAGGLVLCWSSSADRSRSPLLMQRSQPSSPPPPFNNIYPPAPLYKPPEALKGNHAPSLCSLSSNGYRLNNYV
ncbi:claudin-14 [Amphiprion ocellaris]|uniref:Claudin n=1 Tax=Amphiprion ocellaris TaxID=80972 RepID=A0A3Q1CUE9_AMPOC|nr:claudin-14 [Amphiprion ocellaris]XP_054871359.1 claudin-14 [Amphiprion ocellaris]XP_054871360.1 claudin-14 [Amphiprion ocellaris]XP_054871361.1 claudin-14 [Amphiprion ocellaris]XP_054871363.1 claudin-14 [Amphiprion ocellaris]XP_054871364.1 claudin-14 [Amphiprion ocellaris]XP_054871365.1 claudin-14 [Amphiprion ocellaris]XP_054871366.1 claudin-14 [Amphiprion ocellaris]